MRNKVNRRRRKKRQKKEEELSVHTCKVTEKSTCKKKQLKSEGSKKGGVGARSHDASCMLTDSSPVCRLLSCSESSLSEEKSLKCLYCWSIQRSLFLWGESQQLPVSVHVRGTEGEAVVQQGGVDHCAVLRPLQEIAQVTQMPVAASDAVAGAVLVQDKHLAGTEPALWATHNLRMRPQRRWTYLDVHILFIFEVKLGAYGYYICHQLIHHDKES